MSEDDKKPQDITDGGGDHKPESGDDKPGGDKPNSPIHFEVNGVGLVSKHDKLVALDILVMAAQKGAIAGKPEDYILQDKSGEKTYKPDDWVPLREGEEFLAMPGGSTPVASRLK